MLARPWLIACCAAIALAGAAAALAQPIDEPPAKALTGVLKRIKAAGAVRIGYRESAIPFSFAGPAGGQPYGYSIDLCLAVVEDLAAAVGGRDLRVEYRRVTPEDRFDQVVQGRVDLECGSSTSNAERRKRVAFSPVIFVAGTRLLVKSGGPVRSIRDMAGKTVVVVAGTTNEAAMRELATGRARGMRVAAAKGYPQAIAELVEGRADALAADDVLIAGLLAEHRVGGYVMVGQALTHEPYGIVFARDDPALAEVVQGAFARLAATRELRWIYNKWFLRTLPSGVRLGLPMSPALERAFQVLGLPPD